MSKACRQGGGWRRGNRGVTIDTVYKEGPLRIKRGWVARDKDSDKYISIDVSPEHVPTQIVLRGDIFKAFIFMYKRHAKKYGVPCRATIRTATCIEIERAIRE